MIGIAIDTNANGTYDPGIDEILPSPETTVPVAPDQMLTIFIIVEVPAGATAGQRSAANLIAMTATGTGEPGTTFAASGANGADAIVGTSGASGRATGQLQVGTSTVNLMTSASLAEAYRASGSVSGAQLQLAIVAEVIGTGEVTDLAVTNAIPEGTTYAPGSLVLDGTPLTDAAATTPGRPTPAGSPSPLARSQAGPATTSPSPLSLIEQHAEHWEARHENHCLFLLILAAHRSRIEHRPSAGRRGTEPVSLSGEVMAVKINRDEQGEKQPNWSPLS